MNKGTLKQILLITDGCSNKGEDPSVVSQKIHKQGIVVNVIGILSEGEGSDSLLEIEEIATSGGGVSQLVYPNQLLKTVQTVTKQAMNQTLKGVVNQELKQLLSKDQSIDTLPPDQRGEVIEVVEELAETTQMELIVLVDTSLSMQNKLETVKEALIDLSITMNARIGKNQFMICAFPGAKTVTEKVMDWKSELKDLHAVFPKLTSRGVTPTGPALKEAFYQFSQTDLMRSFEGETTEEPFDFSL
ncbi:Ca-activated chloride channel family protein [Pelagirhabdus alkalitolerans]|uniref:Ca-activated chloride channel family protein n=1 Tax=Pelagirhabdus alkalitolerans TaxID=1612202 RepID=A0A1G6MIL9_9BACI|nr:VWA domain-containing protein [Pelagirhabdus alkalitolerans]SDC54836.1 Ca-activated chloride channel family protein [Pelagirhabdus alkalitolerans]